MARKLTSSSAVFVQGDTRVRGRSLATNLLLALRPGQWTKNLVVFAGLIFGQKLLNLADVATASAAFGLFCLFSGVVYLVNDIQDRDADSQHPTKSARPIASGAISTSVAWAAAAIIGAGALLAAFQLDRGFFLVGLTYLILLCGYSVWLKHSVIIDVMAIAFGFVLRAYAGSVVLHVEFSHWLLVLTLLGSLLLGLGKRRGELAALEAGSKQRPGLAHYSLPMLDQMMSVVMAATLLAYAFYTISPETVAKFGTAHLLWTLPLPMYGLFRYLYLIHRGDSQGNPSDLLLADRALQLCILLWAAMLSAIIYGPLK